MAGRGPGAGAGPATGRVTVAGGLGAGNMGVSGATQADIREIMQRDTAIFPPSFWPMRMRVAELNIMASC